MATIKKKKLVKFHSLKRPKIRQDMKKYNLYNLSRMKSPMTRDSTYFQQKWAAKSLTRAYHGQHVREGQWVRMFKRRPPAVVPMNPQYLAQHDGSAEASGRGSGRQPLPQWLENEKVDEYIGQIEPKERQKVEDLGKEWEGPEGEREAWLKKERTMYLKKLRLQYGLPRNNEMTPYMQMVYHPMERRLDQAVYRALFASSAKQARQWVVHGAVKVNGQKMRYPGYLLNPGDMFQCDPPRALWGLGENNTKFGRLRAGLASENFNASNPAPLSVRAQRGAWHEARRATDQELDFLRGSIDEAEERAAKADEEGDEEGKQDGSAEKKPQEDDSDASEQEQSQESINGRKSRLRKLLAGARDVVAKGKEKKSITNKTKQSLRALIKDVRSTQSRVRRIPDSAVADLETRFEEFSTPPTAPPTPAEPEPPQPPEQEPQFLPENAEIQKLRQGPRWIPRQFMSPFIFVPRYLEVNHAICSAVYLRHPVCGPGFAEVPTPYGAETGALAFNWYLRRR